MTLKCTLHINGPKQGFSESYFLRGASYDEAMPVAKRLVRHRASIMAIDHVISWAKISFPGQPRESRAVITGPVQADLQQAQIGFQDLDPNSNPMPALTAADLSCNTSEAALHYRLETASGRWSSRFVRGIPDYLINKGVMTFVLPNEYDPAGPDEEATAEDVVWDLRNKFFWFLCRHTVHFAPLAGDPEGEPEEASYVAYVLRGAGNRDAGSFFGQPAGRQ